MDDLRELGELEKNTLLSLATGMDKIMFLLLFETGMDIHQLINLRVSDLDINKGQLRIAEDKQINLSNEALIEIRDYLKSRPGQIYLLEGRCGKPVTIKWERCILENLRMKARKKK